MTSTNQTAKAGKPPLKSVRLLDKVRERIRYLHYSIRTEEAYTYWIKNFVRWHGMRHPADMRGEEVESFLSHLAKDRNVSASTHKQALSALLFLYKEVQCSAVVRPECRRDLAINAVRPLRWMLHDAGADHVQVNVDEAAMQVFIRLDNVLR